MPSAATERSPASTRAAAAPGASRRRRRRALARRAFGRREHELLRQEVDGHRRISTSRRSAVVASRAGVTSSAGCVVEARRDRLTVLRRTSNTTVRRPSAAEEQRLRERLLQVVLDEAAHRARAERRVVAVVGEPLARRVGVSSIVSLFSASCASSARTSLSTTLQDDVAREAAEEHPGVEAVAELGREGALDRGLRLGPRRSACRCCRSRPCARAISRAPALVVMIRMTLRKSALRPLLSVSVAWSITWSRMLKMSGCAFSISSSRSTA